MNNETQLDENKSTGKHWKTYLFEFLLLFAAVTLGFFADNLRENFSDKQQGRIYIQSFYADLQTDTAIISNIIRYEEEKASILEAVDLCWDSVSNKMPECVGMLVRHSRVNMPFIMRESTYQQLVNVGGFRFLSKQDVDSIQQYITTYRNLQDHQGTIYQESQVNVRSTVSTLINFTALKQMRNVTVNDWHFSLEPNTQVFASTDPVLINRFFSEVHIYRLVIIAHCNQLKRLKVKQVRLLRYLGEKHGLNSK